MMVLKSYFVIFVITISSSVFGAYNFNDDRNLEIELETEEHDQDLEAPQSRSIFRDLQDEKNKYEIFMKLGNGVTVGCEVQKKETYEDITELYLEDEFGRWEPEMGDELPRARFRAINPLFRDPEAAENLLETEVPYGWWPAECIQRIMGFGWSSFESNACNCPAGQPGLAGRPGSDGPQGPIGPPGRPGYNGIDGPNGAPGDEGSRGPPGNKGYKGSLGPQGIPGLVGSIGSPGSPGRDGRNGTAGPQGSPGQNGKPGRNGVNGRNGRNGVTGPAGLPGLPGLQGEAGVAGQQGEQGIPAPNGVNGINGDNGLPGINGKPGNNGPCDNSNGWSPFENPGWSEESTGWSPNLGPGPVQINPGGPIIIPGDDSPPAGDTTNGWTVDETPSGWPAEDTSNGWTADETPNGWVGVPQWTAPEVESSPQQVWTPPSEMSGPPPAPTAEKPGPPMSAPAPGPGSAPGRPQPQQQRPPQQFGMPPMGFPGMSQPGKPNFGGPGNMGMPQAPFNNQMNDKRPSLFQGPNPLWSNPGFQNNPLLQSYPLGGGGISSSGYWKNSGKTRASPNPSRINCAKKKRGNKQTKGKGAAKPTPVSETPQPHEQVVEKKQFDAVPEHENEPPRARVDLDFDEPEEHPSIN